MTRVEMSADVTAYPYGGRTPMPAPPHVLEPDAPAGTSGPLECSRHAGRDDTLHPYGLVGAGAQGYLGRDPETEPYPEGQGMFRRLHQGDA